MDHYLFLRSIWTKESVEVIDHEDRLENLNKKVGFIKGHIKSLIHQETDDSSSHDIRKMIIESKEYTLLKEKYERLLMSQEDKTESKTIVCYE